MRRLKSGGKNRTNRSNKLKINIVALPAPEPKQRRGRRAPADDRNLWLRNGIYYLNAIVSGRRLCQSLDTASKSEARKRRDTVLSEARAGKWAEVDRLAVRSAYPTVDQICAEHERVAAVHHMSRRTITDYHAALRLVIRVGLPCDAPGSQSTGILTAKLVRDFERVRLGEAGPDESRRQSAMISNRSWLKQCRSIFRKRWMLEYADKFTMPDLTGFLETEITAPARQVRSPAPAELLERTRKAAEVLREENPDLYVVYALAAASLRRGEIRHAEWAWLETRDGQPLIHVPVQSKSKRERLVPISADLWIWLQARRATQVPSDENGIGLWILNCNVVGAGSEPGRVRERAKSLLRQINAWMRGLGWIGQHTLHDLRAEAIRSYMLQHGAAAAQEFAGHSSFQITHDHYAGALPAHQYRGLV
jgi:integrase